MKYAFYCKYQRKQFSVCSKVSHARSCRHGRPSGAHIRGGLGGGGAKPPLASECDLKSVPFFFDTVLKLGPKIRVERRRINIYFCQ